MTHVAQPHNDECSRDTYEKPNLRKGNQIITRRQGGKYSRVSNSSDSTLSTVYYGTSEETIGLQCQTYCVKAIKLENLHLSST